MSIKDVCRPHRLLINQALRKDAEKLRASIDEYKMRYDSQRQKNEEELARAKELLDAKFEDAQKALMEKISADAETVKAIGETITDYVTAYFGKNLASKRLEIISTERKIVDESLAFLHGQMKEIGTEIETLRARKELLSRNANIDDILELIRLSGSYISIDGIKDAKDLLNVVSEQMALTREKDKVAWISLCQVKAILEERVSFTAEIQYISWVIDQKIQLSKELKIKRDEQVKRLTQISVETEQIQNEVKSLGVRVKEKAKEIRFHWARKIVCASAELTNCYEEIEDVKIRQKALKDAWDDYVHSSLNSEYSSLSSRIGDLKNEISKVKSTRKEFLEYAYQKSVPIIKIGKKDQSDEEVFAEVRLAELVTIEEEGWKAAETRCQFEKGLLISEKKALLEKKDVAVAEIEERLNAANGELKDAENKLDAEIKVALANTKVQIATLEKQFNDQKQVVDAAQSELKKKQAADSRFILVRLISESYEVKMARLKHDLEIVKLKMIKSELNANKKKASEGSFGDVPCVADARKVVDTAQSKVAGITKEMTASQEAFDEEISKYDRKIEKLKPRPERPTSDEQTEMQRIRTWQKNQKNRPKKERR